MTRRKTAATSVAKPLPANAPANDAPSNGRVSGATALPEPGFADRDEDEIPDVEDAFPDEEETEPESESVDRLRQAPPHDRGPTPPATMPDELAPALVEPTGHVHLSNTERLARQHAAFPGTAPVRARAPAYRRIGPELVKAETKLFALERRRQDSADLHERTWRAKRLALIRSFPAEVRAKLVTMGAVDGAEIEDSGESGA